MVGVDGLEKWILGEIEALNGGESGELMDEMLMAFVEGDGGGNGLGEGVLAETMEAGGLGEVSEVREQGGSGGDGEFGIVDAVMGLKIVFVEVEENGGVEGLGGLELFDLELVGAGGGFPVDGAEGVAGMVGAFASDAGGIGVVLGFAG